MGHAGDPPLLPLRRAVGRPRGIDGIGHVHGTGRRRVRNRHRQDLVHGLRRGVQEDRRGRPHARRRRRRRTRTRADQHPRAGGGGHGGRRRRHDLRPQHLAGRGSDEDGPGAQGGGPRQNDALAGRRTAELGPRGNSWDRGFEDERLHRHRPGHVRHEGDRRRPGRGGDRAGPVLPSGLPVRRGRSRGPAGMDRIDSSGLQRSRARTGRGRRRRHRRPLPCRRPHG